MAHHNFYYWQDHDTFKDWVQTGSEHSGDLNTSECHSKSEHFDVLILNALGHSYALPLKVRTIQNGDKPRHFVYKNVIVLYI